MNVGRIARAAALAAAALLAAGASCSDKIVEPAFEPEGHRMVVVPFKDRLQPSFESPRGNALAETIAERLEAKRKELGESEVIEVVPFEDLVAAVQKRHEDPKEIAPADIGRMVSADLVLLGEIAEFEPQIPGNIGFAAGRATVNVRIVEVAKPKGTFFKQSLAVPFPPQDKGSTGVIPGGGKEEIEAGLMAAIVQKVSELFYAHKEERR